LLTLLGSRFPRLACFSLLDFLRQRFHSRRELVPGLQLLRQVPDSFSCSCAVQDRALVSVPTVLPARFCFCDLLSFLALAVAVCRQLWDFSRRSRFVSAGVLSCRWCLIFLPRGSVLPSAVLAVFFLGLQSGPASSFLFPSECTGQTFFTLLEENDRAPRRPAESFGFLAAALIVIISI
jgi:hypothetical protein